MTRLLFFFLILMSANLFAQEKPRITHSGYGSLTTMYSRFNNEDAIFTGAYGGWFINHKVLIGLGGYGLATSHRGYTTAGVPTKANELKMGYGGLVVEYVMHGSKAVHANLNLLVGAGALVNAHERSRRDANGDKWDSVDESGFVVFQPSLNIETNVKKWFRVSLGGGYRHIASADLIGISNRKMSAPTMNLLFKFGVF